MFDKLVEQGKVFQKLAIALDPGDAENLELMSNLEDKFKEPSQEDKELVMRLVGDSASSLSMGKLSEFAKYFTDLDSYVRGLMHESFTPQFYDLISDENMIEWVYSVKNKTDYSGFDIEAAKFVLNDINTFDSVDKVFS